MKKLILYSFISFITLLFCSHSSFAQVNDTVENKIRNQFIKAVEAASAGSTDTQYIFIDDFTVQKQREYTKYVGNDALDIYRESIKYYVDGKSQVIENLFNFDNPQYVIQSIKLITIETDTSGGFAVDGISPGPTMPKHMDMILHWKSDSDKNWKISYFYRSAIRDRR